MGLLEGKVALITGAARGQGRAHAVWSAREGADVIVTDIAEQISTVLYDMATEEDLAETVREVEALGRRALSHKADTRSSKEMDDVVAAGIAEFGQIDCVIINHGIFNLGSFWELSEEQWGDMIDVNLTGVWKTAKAVTPHMIERKSGSIVIVSSLNGIRPAPAWAHYTAAKHGAVGLMRSIALELAPYGIRCNAILPGGTLTPMVDNPHGWAMMNGHDQGTREEALESGHSSNPLRDTAFMDPDEIAKTAVYLNSELASKITGLDIPVDAGHLLLTGFNHNPVRS
ncbi:mycofactocin-coupled SDR family oxidoreductase [Mycobacterium sp. NAZ190054]|uniref:mycofactocin-coupled SDR family oxidoreductase n=1 Tax=Mycobacterium sp. NAZ190054 TaxID=1747766 RepID=UPI00079833E9|nr:mycofactocin-coupled SDR family oxidoreductase [Mycobacterium sp. NAZ190054]KWX57769.1 oxidoreductase [Mycobacterium sp. NAZ190054]